MRILVLETVLANLLMQSPKRNWANLWLLPPPKLLGQRIGLAAETFSDVEHKAADEESFWWWFYTERCLCPELQRGVGSVRSLRHGVLGTVKLERVAEPGELGRAAVGPAVWVFSEPRIETVTGKLMRAGYSDQPHVVERDRVAAAAEAARKGSEANGAGTV